MSITTDLTKEDISRFWNQVSEPDENGCMWWQGRRSGGRTPYNVYGKPRIRGQDRHAHRVAFELAFGEISEGYFVCHRCDNPLCVNPEHLFQGSRSENMADCGAKGRANKSGNNNGRAILSPEKVRRIREESPTESRRMELAKEFGVSPQAIYFAQKGHTWKSV